MMANFSIVLCLIMASLQPLSTSLPPMGISLDTLGDLWKTEFFHEALNWAGDIDAVVTILKNTLDRVQGEMPRPRSTPRGSPGTNEEQERESRRESEGESKRDQERVREFLKYFKKLLEFMDKYELVRVVCEFAFDFLELAAMRFLTTSPRGAGAMKQAWPAETAQIEAILVRVKSEMEGVQEEFNEAMLVVQQAVSAKNDQQRTQALRRYEAIKSVIQPVFDTCLKFMKQAQAVLKTLEPKVENMIEESKDTAVMVSSPVIHVVASLAIANAWTVPLAALVTGVSFGISIYRRHELFSDLAYYNSEIMIIIKLETMKNKLKSGHDFLFDYTWEGGVMNRLLD